MRMYVIGNCGSGKTYLASRSGLRHLDLDTVFWENNFSRKRPNHEIIKDINAFINDNENFVIEGVYLSLFELVVSRCDVLVYLDIEEDVCVKNMISKNKEDRVDYAKSYYHGRRFVGDNEIYSKIKHDELFDNFNGRKIKIKDLEGIDKFLNEISKNGRIHF